MEGLPRSRRLLLGMMLIACCHDLVRVHGGPITAFGTAGEQQEIDKAAFRCAAKSQRPDVEYVAAIGSEMLRDNDTQVCRPRRGNGTNTAAEDERLVGCYVVWTEEETEGGGRKISVKTQGCHFNNFGDFVSCSHDSCVAHSGTKMNNTYYCCCSTPMCNSNFTRSLDVARPTMLAPDESAEALSTANDTKILIAVGASLISLCVLVLVLYFIYRKKALQYAPKQLLIAASEVASGRSSGPASRLLSPVSVGGGGPDAQPGGGPMGGGLKMDALLHRGKFGEVWRAVLDSHGEVCVKVFNSSQSQHALYLNERDVYSLPMMQHDAIVRCLAAEEYRPGGSLSAQYFIVMEYHPLGSLNAYLKGAKGSLSFQTMCSMCHSIAAGLGHLHLEIGSTFGGPPGGPYKPAIVHRDFNSRNILVKSDLTCAVADMGFALKIKGSKYCRNGQEENIEEASLRDVGTVRYMAPEILDGAVNLRECETSLKQIDVYALGLVMWEVATQCCDLYQGNRTTQPYRIPYEEEVGLNPTFEDMQTCVSKNRHRPAFPSAWKDAAIVQSIKETIQDCWDYDAEARLTAMCVQERFRDFSTLAEVRNRPSSLIAVNQNVDGKSRTATCPPRVDLIADKDDKETSPLLGSSSIAAEPSTKMDINVELDQNRRLQQAIAGRNSLISRNTMLPNADDEALDVIGNSLVRRSVPGADSSAQPSGGVGSATDQGTASNATMALLPPRRGSDFFSGGGSVQLGMPTVPVRQYCTASNAGATIAVENVVDGGTSRRTLPDAAFSTAFAGCPGGLQKKVPNCSTGADGHCGSTTSGLEWAQGNAVQQQCAPQAGTAAVGSGNGGFCVLPARSSTRPDSLALRLCTK